MMFIITALQKKAVYYPLRKKVRYKKLKDYLKESEVNCYA